MKSPLNTKGFKFVENEKQVLVKISGYLKTIESTEVLIHENIKLDDVFLNADDKRFDDFQDFLKLLKHYTEKTIAELDKSFKLVEKLSDTDFTRKIEKTICRERI
jgi:PDZ domain-containing secreted protein